MQKRALFSGSALPYLLVLPQLAVLLVFFFWPAGQAVFQSMTISDPFGFRVIFVGLDNFNPHSPSKSLISLS